MNQPNQPNQQNPRKDDKQMNPSSGQKSGQQTQQGTRPGQGGFTSPGHGNQGGQSAPSDKK
jgi:hypothetical protein